MEYLQYLQNLIDENNRKEVELIMRLKTLELKAANRPSENIPIRIGYTSAEKALGEIGVGPCSEEYFKNVLIKSASTSKSGRREVRVDKNSLTVIAFIFLFSIFYNHLSIVILIFRFFSFFV